MEEAINLVVLALNEAVGGEIFVPKLKSFKITFKILYFVINLTKRLCYYKYGDKHER